MINQFANLKHIECGDTIFCYFKTGLDVLNDAKIDPVKKFTLKYKKYFFLHFFSTKEFQKFQCYHARCTYDSVPCDSIADSMVTWTPSRKSIKLDA